MVSPEPIERDLTAGQQQPQRDRPIEAVGALLEIGRSGSSRRKGANVHWLVSLRRFWRGLTWLVPGRAKTSPAGVAYAVPGTPKASWKSFIYGEVLIRHPRLS